VRLHSSGDDQMTRYIPVHEAIDLIAKELSEYYERSAGDRLRLIPDEIDLELALSFLIFLRDPAGMTKTLADQVAVGLLEFSSPW